VEQTELERIVTEYCDSLKEQLMRNIKHFESDWNGLHIRVLAGMITDIKNDHPSVKKAERQIRKSMTYYQLSL
jgi:hypothetical protein